MQENLYMHHIFTEILIFDSKIESISNEVESLIVFACLDYKHFYLDYLIKWFASTPHSHPQSLKTLISNKNFGWTGIEL